MVRKENHTHSRHGTKPKTGRKIRQIDSGSVTVKKGQANSAKRKSSTKERNATKRLPLARPKATYRIEIWQTEPCELRAGKFELTFVKGEATGGDLLSQICELLLEATIWQGKVKFRDEADATDATAFLWKEHGEA